MGLVVGAGGRDQELYPSVAFQAYPTSAGPPLKLRLEELEVAPFILDEFGVGPIFDDTAVIEH